MVHSRPGWLRVALLAVLVGGMQGGRWDHRRSYSRHRRPTTTPRTTTTTTTTTTTPAPPPPRAAPPARSWEHSLGWERPAHRCQAEGRRLAGGRTIDSTYVDYVRRLLVEDKVLLAPLVFEGAMVSRTNTYKSFYFVSFKVFRVLKGTIHQQLTGQVRLLFQSQAGRQGRGRRPRRPGHCPPVPFNVRSGRKYLVFVRQVKSAGRYAAVAEPELVRKKTLKAARGSLACPSCATPPVLKTAHSKRVVAGRRLKLNCKVSNKAFPWPAIAWYKDGALLTNQERRVTIHSKKKRSSLSIVGSTGRDAGLYTCQATNLAGSSQQATSVSVRNAVSTPYHAAARCPIDNYCLNGGGCAYYKSIGELVCRCTEGFTGQRCQYKKALKFKYHNPLNRTTSGCGLYGYDINQLCSAWREAPEEMTKEQYQDWKRVSEVEEGLKAPGGPNQ